MTKNEYVCPSNFNELVERMETLIENEYIENDDTGKLRHVEVGYMYEGRYAMYEDYKPIGFTNDVVTAAQFIAKGWEPYERG